jgi:hypothetical protein
MKNVSYKQLLYEYYIKPTHNGISRNCFLQKQFKNIFVLSHTYTSFVPTGGQIFLPFSFLTVLYIVLPASSS